MTDGRCSPVLVHLQSARAGLHLLDQALGSAAVPLAEKADVHGEDRGGFEHSRQVPRPGCARRALGAVRGTGAAADQRCDAVGQRVRHLLRGQEVDVGVDGPWSRDETLAGDHLGAGTDDQVRAHAVLHVRVAGLPDADDPAVLHADVGLDDPDHGIHHDGGGDDEVEDPVGVPQTGHLTHAVAQRLPAAVDGLLAGQQQAALDSGDQVCVGQPEPVADGRSVEGGVLLTGDRAHDAPRGARSSATPCLSSQSAMPAKPRWPLAPVPPARSRAADVAPSSRLLKPITRPVPPNSTSSMSRSSPASKRIDCPDGTSRRIPNVAGRSKSNARLTSKKWKCEPTWIGRSPVLRTDSPQPAVGPR